MISAAKFRVSRRPQVEAEANLALDRALVALADGAWGAAKDAAAARRLDRDFARRLAPEPRRAVANAVAAGDAALARLRANPTLRVLGRAVVVWDVVGARVDTLASSDVSDAVAVFDAYGLGVGPAVADALASLSVAREAIDEAGAPGASVPAARAEIARSADAEIARTPKSRDPRTP